MKTELVIIKEERAKNELAESEQRYRRLLGATTDYIYTVQIENGQSGPTSHGEGCLAVTGYSSAEFDADPGLWYRVIHVEDRPAVLAQVDRVMSGDTPPPLEHRITPKQGGVRWVRNTTIPHRDHRGRLVAYDGLLSDITDGKRSELLLTAECAVARELTEQEGLEATMPRVLEQLCRVLLWHHGAYWHCTGQHLRCESEFWRTVLRPPDPESRASMRILSVGAGLPGRVCSIRRAIWIPDVSKEPELKRNAPPCRAGLRCGCAFPIGIDERIVGVVELYSGEAQPRDGRMLAALSTLGIHIGQFAERRESQEQLNQERNLLRTLIDHLPDCIFVKDTNSRFLLNNLAHSRVLGVAKPRDALGKTDQDFFPEELAARYRADEEAVLRSGQPLHDHEEPVVDRAGQRYLFLTTKVPVQNDAGATVGLVGIGRNITDLKRAEQELRRKNQELERTLRDLTETRLQLHQVQRLKAVGTLAAGVAHEVKNPLQILALGTTDLAARLQQPDSDVRQTLREMRDAITRANTIIKSLLDFSRLTKVNLQPASVENVLDAALRLQRFNLLRNRVQVLTAYEDNLPVVPLDQQRMQQVFINLIGNALEAMPEGGKLTVRAYSRSCTFKDRLEALDHTSLWHPGNRLVAIEFEDTGKGVPEEILAHLFEPFITTKPSGTGTGLGLSVAKNIISLHGGTIHVENRRTQGARITIQLITKDKPYEDNTYPRGR